MLNKEVEKLSGESFEALTALLRERMDPALLGFGYGKIIEFFASVGASSKPVTDPGGRPLRWQDKVIEQEIPVGSLVLDLGCGSGDLLLRLMDMKQVRGQGLELDPKAVLECVRRGVPVFQSDIAEGLRAFSDGAFDFVVLEETLQTLQKPVEVLRQMLRVGRRAIVSFPNFAFWQVRLDLLIRGRMPQTGWLPYNWHDTPNIHGLSLQDFLDWAKTGGVEIVEGYVLNDGAVRKLQLTDNLYAEEALLIVRSAEETRG